MKLTQTYAFESLTVSTTAVGFTESVYSSTLNTKRPMSAYVTVETDAIRYRTDGTAPTSSVGHSVASGESFEIIGSAEIRNFKAIRSGSSDATLRVSYGR